MTTILRCWGSSRENSLWSAGLGDYSMRISAGVNFSKLAKFERLDNETSKKLLDFMKKENILFKNKPPNYKFHNAAERAIRTFKNHFIATLCTVDKDFPLQLWDTLLQQTELLCLNLLRGSRPAYRLGNNCMASTTSMHTRSPHLVFVSSCMKTSASTDHGRHMRSTVSISG